MIEINLCDEKEIAALPKVGPATTRKIMEARPIEDIGTFEKILPPSAWLALQEADVQISFALEKAATPEPPSFGAETAPFTTIAQPPMILPEHGPMTLRRVMGGDELREGARYICLWNMHWGPSGEAFFPNDAPTQAEVEGWFNAHGMEVLFAHYGQSVRVHTTKGPVPLLLFEIVEETDDETSTGDQ